MKNYFLLILFVIPFLFLYNNSSEFTAVYNINGTQIGTINPHLSLNQNVVSSASLITVTGTNFHPNSPLTIIHANGINILPLIAGGVTTDNTGGFSFSFSLPATLPHRTINIFMADDFGNTVTTPIRIL